MRAQRFRLAVVGLIAAVLATGPVPGHAGVMSGELRPPPTYTVAPKGKTMRVGFAEVLNFPALIDTVVVGDGAVADATVLDGNSIVVTALAPGLTNIIVMAAEGGAMARLVLRVRAERFDTTAIYRGTQRTVLRCNPVCVPVGVAADPAQ